jgi:ATP-dependent RNA helicase RhlE
VALSFCDSSERSYLRSIERLTRRSIQVDTGRDRRPSAAPPAPRPAAAAPTPAPRQPAAPSRPPAAASRAPAKAAPQPPRGGQPRTDYKRRKPGGHAAAQRRGNGQQHRGAQQQRGA